MSKDNSTPKIGAGHFKAMGRQGLAELRAAMYAESNVAQPPGPGIYGNPTQSEIAKERDPAQQDRDERSGDAEKTPNHPEPPDEQRGPDLERD